MVERQAGDQRLQQLRLARTGRAGDQGVRSRRRQRSMSIGPSAVRPSVATRRSRTVDHAPASRPCGITRSPRRGRSSSRTDAGRALAAADRCEAGQVAGEFARPSAGRSRSTRDPGVVGRAPAVLSTATSPVSPASRTTASTPGRAASRPTPRSTASPRPRRRASRSVATTRGSSGRSTTTTSQPAAARRRSPGWRHAAAPDQPCVSQRVEDSSCPCGLRAGDGGRDVHRAGRQVRQPPRPGPVVQPVGVEQEQQSTSPGACRAVSCASTPASTPSARSRGPTTPSPPARAQVGGDRQVGCGRADPGAVALDPPSPRCSPGPRARSGRRARRRPSRPRLQSRRERRRAAVVIAARSGAAASARPGVGRARAAASRSARGHEIAAACAAALRRPARRPDQRSESQVPSATTRAEQGEEQEGGRVQDQRHQDAADRRQRDRHPGEPPRGAASGGRAGTATSTSDRRRASGGHRPEPEPAAPARAIDGGGGLRRGR